MTTTSATRFASSTSLRWPSCRAPIVGTKAMLFPLALRSAVTWRISEIVSTSCMSETVLGVRVRAAANIARPVSDCRADFLRHLRVALQKFWLEGIVEPQNIREHEDLPVAFDTRANADGRDSNRRRDASGDRGWHQLQHYGKGAGLLESFCLRDEQLRALLFTALNASAANRIHRLRSKPDMGHHRNSGANESVHGVQHFRTSTLDLHRANTS